MLPIDLTKITVADLEALVTQQTPEGRSLDYKREVQLQKGDDKNEFVRDVASFANGGGGDIIIGVEEAKDKDDKNLGYPAAIIGVPGTSTPSSSSWKPSSGTTSSPGSTGSRSSMWTGSHATGDGHSYPESWNAPHMTTYSSHTRFYSRNSAGKYSLDVHQIRSAFLKGSELASRIRAFRSERLGLVISGETPVVLAADRGPTLVVHGVPLADDGVVTVDLLRLKQHAHLRPIQSDSWSTRFNFYGLVAFNGHKGPYHSYSQAFRNGALEAVVGEIAAKNANEGRFSIYPLETENYVVTACNMFITITKTNSFVGPLLVLVSVVDVRGAKLHGSTLIGFDQGMPIASHDTLLLPDVLVEEGDDPRVVLRPVFDALWQSGGFERSYGYNERGQWDVARHPRS